MNDVLVKILANKSQQVKIAKEKISQQELEITCSKLPACRGFVKEIRLQNLNGNLAVIAESKQKSPSAGELAQDYDIATRAKFYAEGGATCMSVLTDTPYFGGSSDDVLKASKACELPILRKDFIVDEWQLFETRAIGADCILLIATVLSSEKLSNFAKIAMELGLDVLVEIHAEDEIRAAIASGSELIGVNNRNLDTLVSDLTVSEKLIPKLKSGENIIVSESAILTIEDCSRVIKSGAQAVLVGEVLMKKEDPLELLQKFTKLSILNNS